MPVMNDIRRLIGATDDSEVRDELSDVESDADGVTNVMFAKKNVAANADHQLAFHGAYTYLDDERTHAIEREFRVFTDPDERTDDGKPRAIVHEDHLAAVEESPPGTVGDEPELIAQRERELVINIDEPFANRMEETRIEDYCEQWHADHQEQA